MLVRWTSADRLASYGSKEVRRAFGRADLIAVIVIVAIVALIVFANWPRGHGLRHSTHCKNHLSQMGKARFHHQDNMVGELPADRWETELEKYIDWADGVFVCAARDEEQRYGGIYHYAFNTASAEFTLADSRRIVLVDSDHRLIEFDISRDGTIEVRGLPVDRHQGVNALMHDGSVQSFELSEIFPDRPEVIRKYWLPAAKHDEIGDRIVFVE